MTDKIQDLKPFCDIIKQSPCVSKMLSVEIDKRIV